MWREKKRSNVSHRDDALVEAIGPERSESVLGSHPTGARGSRMPQAQERLAKERSPIEQEGRDDEDRLSEAGKNTREVSVRELGVDAVQQVEVCVHWGVGPEIMLDDGHVGKEYPESSDRPRRVLRAHELELRRDSREVELEEGGADAVRAQASGFAVAGDRGDISGTALSLGIRALRLPVRSRLRQPERSDAVARRVPRRRMDELAADARAIGAEVEAMRNGQAHATLGYGPVATAALTESMPRRESVTFALPPLVLALSLSGFWLYLGALELAGVEPRSALTAGYYLLLGSGLVAAALTGRDTIRRRLSTPSRLPLVWSLTAGALVLWFLANVALLSSGTAARDAAALLVLSSAPSALVILSLSRAQIRVAAGALVLLALGLSAVSLVVLITNSTPSVRFSPIDELDPISTARFIGLGAIVLMAWRFGTRRAQLAQGSGVALLIALTILPASRGALLALVAGVVAVAAILRERLWPILLPAVVMGFILGALGSFSIGSDYYYTADVPGVTGVTGHTGPPEDGVDFTGEAIAPGSLDGQQPISSLAIRRYLVTKALKKTPDHPIFGHGVGMLVDDSPDTLRMVRAGRLQQGTRTHPHNVLVESLYSLGALGFGLFVTLLIASAVALIRVLKGGKERFVALLALALAAVSAVNASVSGEIGSDAYLWIALALPVALYADEAPVTSSR